MRSTGAGEPAEYPESVDHHHQGGALHEEPAHGSRPVPSAQPQSGRSVSQPGSAIVPGSLSAVGLRHRSHQPGQGVSQVSSGQITGTGTSTIPKTIDQARARSRTRSTKLDAVLVGNGQVPQAVSSWLEFSTHLFGFPFREDESLLNFPNFAPGEDGPVGEKLRADWRRWWKSELWRWDVNRVCDGHTDCAARACFRPVLETTGS